MTSEILLDLVTKWLCQNGSELAKGALGFFYHSVKEKRVVGIVEVVEEYHPDPTDPRERFGMVTVVAIRPMPDPVTLADIKAEPRLADMALVKQSRLSVTPVTAAQWKLVCKMGGL